MKKITSLLLPVLMLLTACQPALVAQPTLSNTGTSTVIDTSTASVDVSPTQTEVPSVTPSTTPSGWRTATAGPRDPHARPDQPIFSITSAADPDVLFETTATPQKTRFCAYPLGHYATKEEILSGASIARVPIEEVSHYNQKEVVALLVKQWLEHNKTQREDVYMAIKDYSIDYIILDAPTCAPEYLVYAPVAFSIIPFQIPNGYAPITREKIGPNDLWWPLGAPFAVFKYGNEYRLRLVAGYGT